MMLHQNYKQIKLPNEFFVLPARISPKEISGANGKFLPKPLLFHLRHPNSKTNEPKFWQILSPKNSFAKTSSALKPHALPRNFLGRTPKEKHPFLFKKKFHPRQIRNARSVFSFGVAEALRGSGGTIHSRSKKVRANDIMTPPKLICIRIDRARARGAGLGWHFRQEIPRGFEFHQKHSRRAAAA